MLSGQLSGQLLMNVSPNLFRVLFGPLSVQGFQLVPKWSKEKVDPDIFLHIIWKNVFELKTLSKYIYGSVTCKTDHLSSYEAYRDFSIYATYIFIFKLCRFLPQKKTWKLFFEVTYKMYRILSWKKPPIFKPLRK